MEEGRGGGGGGAASPGAAHSRWVDGRRVEGGGRSWKVIEFQGLRALFRWRSATVEGREVTLRSHFPLVPLRTGFIPVFFELAPGCDPSAIFDIGIQ